MKFVLETKRLVLREFCLADAPYLYALNTDPDVIKYTGDLPFKSIPEAQQFIYNYADYKKNGFGRLAVLSKTSNNFLGWCGLKLNEEELIDIGFRFFKAHWNNGLATESGRKVLEYGFSTLGMSEIIGRASLENKASIKVLEKLNMRLWKLADSKEIGLMAYYRINKVHLP